MSEAPYSDEELLEFGRTLHSFARSLGHDPSSADDLMQEAWLAALEEPRGRVRDLHNWLRRVVRNLAARDRRRNVLRSDSERWAARTEASTPEADPLGRVSTYEMLRETTAELDPPYREVIQLRFFEQLALEEVAQSLDRPIETVKSQLRRGLGQLRDRLDRRHAGDRSVWTVALWRAADGEDAGVAQPSGKGRPSPESSTKLGSLIVPGLAAAVVIAGVAWWVQIHRGAQPAAAERALASSPDSEPDGLEAADPSPALASERQSIGGPPVGVETGSAADLRTVSIRVVERDGAPAAFATVTVLGKGKIELYVGTVDGTGRRELEFEAGSLVGSPTFIPEPGVMVYATRPGWASSPFYHLPCPPDGAELELRLGAEAFVLHGQVEDEAGAPVANAAVLVTAAVESMEPLAGGTVAFERQYEIQTAADGSFALEHLTPGMTRVIISVQGYQDYERLERGAPGLELERLYVLTSSGILVGRVRLPDGSPAAGARLWVPANLYAQSPAKDTHADDQGRFRLTAVDDHRTHVFACAADDERLVAAHALALRSGEQARWDPVLRATPGVRVRALKGDGRPAVGRFVILAGAGPMEEWAAMQITDQDGRCTFLHVPDETLQLHVIPPDYARDLADPTLVSGVRPSSEEISVVVSAPRTKGGIQGWLLDAGGSPISRGMAIARHTERDLGRPAPLGSDGAFVWTALSLGVQRILLSCDDFGLVDLGEHEVRANVVIDLGTVRAPAPVSVQLDLPRAGREVEFSVRWVAKVGQREFRELVLYASGKLPRELELFPGEYDLSWRSSGRQIERRIRVEPMNPQQVTLR